MKKLLVSIFSAFLLLACSTEEGTPDLDGLYACQTSAGSICACVRAGKCIYISIEDSENLFVWEGLRTTGSYPEYNYSLEGFTASFRYTDTSAAAILDGVLKHEDGEGPNIAQWRFPFDQTHVTFYRQ